MNHPEIERDEIVERYVQRRLNAEDERSFEDHYFGCDQCFANVQALEQLRAGVRDAARAGALAPPQPAARSIPTWWAWVLGASVAATVALPSVAAWQYFKQVRDLRGRLDLATAALATERAAARANAGQVRTPESENSIAFVMLSASRDANRPDTVVLAPAAPRLLLWIDTAPARFTEFRLDITDANKRAIVSVDHLRRNAYGALLASVPADKLPTGEVRITLSGEAPPPATLVGDYRLTIEKR